MLELPSDVLPVTIARLLDGYAERDGKRLFERREIEVRFLENAGN
jgi:hypothetical protein